MGALYAIVRIKGRVNVPKDVEYTLKLLRLHKRYHAVVYPKDLPGLDGMLHKVKDFVTWGEIKYETLVELLKKRGRVVGGHPLNDDYANTLLKRFGLEGGVEALAKAIHDGLIRLHKQRLIKPVFRLSPPKGGFKRSIKKPFSDGGETGYRGEAINDLLLRMI